MSPKPPMRRSGWYDRALTAIERLARRQRFITSDDLYGELGADPPPHHNGVGAVFNEARHQGVIKSTRQVVPSERAPAKGRNVQVWESMWWREPSDAHQALDAFVADRTGKGQERLL